MAPFMFLAGTSSTLYIIFGFVLFNTPNIDESILDDDM